MLLSSTHFTFTKKMPEKSTEEIIEIMADAGFDAIDFSFQAKPEYRATRIDGGVGKDEFTEWRKRAEDRGLVFNQAHAPYDSSFDDMDKTVKRFHEIRRSIINASYLGIPRIVVHPVKHLPYWESGVPERLFEWNLKFFGALKPYAEEYGVTICIENMYRQPTELYVPSVCSDPNEFVRYVDALDSECFKACLDVGHAALVKVDPCDSIRALGKDRLWALHIHDVDLVDDLHTLPYLAKINWDSVCATLKEIGYEDDFTFEAYNFLKPIPRELVIPAAKFMVKTGRHLINKIQNGGIKNESGIL